MTYEQAIEMLELAKAEVEWTYEDYCYCCGQAIDWSDEQ